MRGHVNQGDFCLQIAWEVFFSKETILEFPFLVLCILECILGAAPTMVSQVKIVSAAFYQRVMI